MKHFYILAAASLGIFCANAQVSVKYSEKSELVQLMGESMSENAKYVVGTNYVTFAPCAWDVENNIYFDFADLEEGALHAVNNSGFAVGDNGNFAVAGNIDGELVELWRNVGEEVYNEEWDFWYSTGDAGSAAYAVTEDGQTIFGYYFDSTYDTKPCYWRNGERVDLPVPAYEDVDFNVNGAEVRWCTADGSLLLGYIFDDLGTWPACMWRLQNDGSYVCDPICKEYFEVDYNNGKPYMLFTPYGMSADGQWVSLSIQEEYDAWNWAPETPIQFARLNVASGALEILADEEENFNALATPSCIANDGTMTIIANALAGMVGREAYVWKSGANKALVFAETFGELEGMDDLLCNTPCTYSANGASLQGFAMDADTNIFSYIVTADGTVKINTIATNNNDSKIYNVTGQQVNDATAPGLYIVDGKKTVVK